MLSQKKKTDWSAVLKRAKDDDKLRDVVSSLLSSEGTSLNEWGLDGLPLLHSALYCCHESLATYLVERGADIRLADSTGREPLSWASEVPSMDGVMVSLLLEKGVNIDAQGCRGRSALMWASLRGNKVAVELLLRSGANVLLKDREGDTAIGFSRKS